MEALGMIYLLAPAIAAVGGLALFVWLALRLLRMSTRIVREEWHPAPPAMTTPPARVRQPLPVVTLEPESLTTWFMRLMVLAALVVLLAIAVLHVPR